MLYNKMLNEQSRLIQKIQQNREIIKQLPAGSFYCTEEGSQDKWYRKTEGSAQQYIPKSQREHAVLLAYKRFLLTETKNLEQQLQATEAYLRKYPDKDEAQELLSKRGYRNLLQDFVKPLDRELAQWAQAPFEQNPYKPESKIHHVYPGLSVRSKSEALIATQLHMNRIPFRYECVLYLGRTPVYPDFTVRHPKTGETYYWEHLGLLEDPAYAQRVGTKIQRYAQAKIYVNRQLILTDEAPGEPLTVSEINKIIQDKFQ